MQTNLVKRKKKKRGFECFYNFVQSDETSEFVKELKTLGGSKETITLELK